MIQTEWSLSPQVFHLLCSKWARPQIDLFATRFNHRLRKFVSPVPDPAAWAVDALSLSWGNLDMYAFPPVSLLNQVGFWQKAERNPCMVVQKHQASGKLESGLPISIPQFLIQESASPGRSCCCGTGGHSCFGPVIRQVSQGR